MIHVDERVGKLSDSKRKLLDLMSSKRTWRMSTYPLSYAQQRLWLVDQLDPGSSTYNVSFGVRLNGRLDKNALRRSIQEIVRRHEVLRTSFPARDGRPVQKVLAELLLPVEELDLRATAAENREAEAKRLAQEEMEKPFDLARGPLLRIKLLQLEAEEYVLLINMHHIVSDAWSSGITVRELTQLYQAYHRGQPSPLPELEFQYGDFALWQRSWLQGETLGLHLQYWRNQLAEAPFLELPSDWPRPEAPSHRGASVFFEISTALTEKLNELGRREGVTLFMTLLTAFQVMLAKYTGQRDVSVGTAVANRNRVETEPLIGFFVNTLVLRTRLDGNPTFQEVLERVRHVALDAYQHQDLPFEKLVEELQPERDLSRTPLFQVMLVLQNTGEHELDLPGLRLSSFFDQADVAKFDLLLTLSENPSGISGGLSYACDLFKPETAKRLVAHFQLLLETMVHRPEQRIGELSLVTESERRQLLVECNQTQAAYPEKSVHELYEAQASATPEALAVEHEGGRLTYSQLNGRANQLARTLLQLGVEPEDRVGVCLDRGRELFIALLGILKAGAAYVPLDPNYPAERLNYMAEDAALKVLLTTNGAIERSPVLQGRVVRLDGDWEEIAKHSPENLGTPTHPENLAYVIYTSGSTGRPKGVLGLHRGAVNRFAWMWRNYPFAPGEICCQKTSISFVDSISEMLVPLLAGVPVVVVSDEEGRNPAKLTAVLAEKNISRIVLVPSLLQAILDAEGGLEGGVEERLPHLRLWMSSGEALPLETGKRFQERFKGRQLLNLYGSSEASADATCMQAGDQEHGATVPIGAPIANTRVYLLDERFNPVPLGVIGELYVGGVGLARGYLNHPDLTAEKFLPNAFSQDAGERLYRTGDLAKWMPDGNLQFIGRRDHQVKVRGHRIELGEIESALNAWEGIAQTVVIPREDQPGGTQLVAYLVLKPETRAPYLEELRAYLRKRLPEYMVPAVFVVLGKLPLTASGKLDRKGLPAPERQAIVGTGSGFRNSEEEILCGIFADVLKLERVGIEDNFFALGGHSLLGTQVMARITRAFEVELPLRALFETPTAAGLAGRVRDARAGSHRLAPPIVPTRREGPLPLSFAQQRLWFIDQLEPGNVAYNLPLALSLSGELNESALQRSLQEILRRHEALRTSFPEKNGEPVQEIAAALELVIKKIDIRSFPEEERQAKIASLVEAEARKQFNLSHAPLMRMKLLQCGDKQYVLLATIHHIISDLWSMSVMVREFIKLYDAYAKGTEPGLPELKIQYADFAAWQREWFQGEVLASHLEYWKEQLTDAPVLAMPLDRTRAAVASHRGERLWVQLPGELTRALASLSRREGVTLYMTLLAAFQALLSRYSGQADVVIGTSIAGRIRPETEPLIGIFFNMLALRTNLSGDPEFRELLGRVRETTLSAYAHQELPFERLVAELQPDRNLSFSPLFQVVLELQNTPQEAIALPGLEVKWIPTATDATKFDLTLSLAETADGLTGTLEYSADLFNVETMRRLISHYQTLLEGVCANPKQRLSELPLLSRAERHRLVMEWNSTKVEYERKCMHELFEEQVEKTPERVAVEAGARRLTYRQLDQKANQLAHYLRHQGVGAEERVGLCVERSLEMVVGLLGILKAGGAYVALDPSYPEERVGYMLEDSGARVVLTQQRLLDKLPRERAGKQVICLDSDWGRIQQESEARMGAVVSADYLAYIYYTSGSTGRPKGVAIAHYGIGNYIQWGVEAYAAAGGKGAGVHSSIAVDLTLTNFLPLFAGQAVVLAEEGPGVEGLLKLLREQPEWSLLKLTPTHLALLNSLLTAEEMRHSARVLVIGADNLVAEPTLVWRELAAGVELLNEYGPTETVVGCSVYRIGEKSPRRGGMPIGRPIANITMYVLDGECQPVPVGVAGELYIGGIGVARGYWGRPELTAEKFVPDGFSAEPGARLYKTGDRARWLEDGNLEFLGRLDHQVKIRGFRIEPGEVEAALSGYPGVQKVMVVVREDVPGEKRLVGYVTGPGAELGVSEMRQYLKERLPEYMVPGAIVVMEELPVRASGKIDPKDLPRPEIHLDPQAYVAPRNETESILCGIWADILGIPKVGIYDNFFQLGGDSILSIQVVARARQAGMHLTPRQVFERQMIAELAACANAGAGAVAAEQGLMSGLVPLTPIQVAFFQRELARPEHYNNAVLLELNHDIESFFLERAFLALLEHHDVLRTRYERTDKGWQQWCTENIQEGIYERRDFSGLEEHQRSLELERDAAQLQQSLDLPSGRLVKAVEYDLGEKCGRRLLLLVHHLLVDGVSWRILLADLEQAYEQVRVSGVAQLGAKTTSYRQWAQRLHDYSRDETLKEQVGYWSSEKRKMVKPLPRDYQQAGEANLLESMQSVVVRLAKEETDSLLQEVPSVFHTQINDVLLSALGAVCAEWTGGQEVLVEVDGHGRAEIFPDVDFSRTVGWFTSMYPVLLEMGPPEYRGPAGLLGDIKEQLRKVPHRGVGYGVLRYLSQPQDPGTQVADLPSPEISFNYLGQFDQVFRGSKVFRPAREAVGRTIAVENQRRHLLEIEGIVVEGKLQLSWNYNANMHRRETVEKIAGRYMSWVREVIYSCRNAEARGYTP